MATDGATPVKRCTWAASSIFSYGFRAAPGFVKTLNRVPGVAVRPRRCLDPLPAQSLLDLTLVAHCPLLSSVLRASQHRVVR